MESEFCLDGYWIWSRDTPAQRLLSFVYCTIKFVKNETEPDFVVRKML